MSYSSMSYLPKKTSLSNVQEFIELLGYNRQSNYRFLIPDIIAHYCWFDDTDYRSSAGVLLSIYKNNNGEITIGTETPVARSYWDLRKQNETIRKIRKQFGGTFVTDEGKGRYLHEGKAVPAPAALGCDRAFQKFGLNIIWASIYFRAHLQSKWAIASCFSYFLEHTGKDFEPQVLLVS